MQVKGYKIMELLLNVYILEGFYENEMRKQILPIHGYEQAFKKHRFDLVGFVYS